MTEVEADSAVATDRVKQGALGALYRHELKVLLYASPTYLFQAGMLLALSVAIFLVANYYNSDQASVEPLLTFLPWVGLVFVPALGMRAWAEGPNDRASEILLTLPVSAVALVVAKFLAGATLLVVTLLFTVCLPATAAYLGNPDSGAILAIYVAAACMLCVYYAASLLAASMVNEPVSAFVIAVVLLLTMLVPGWDIVQHFLQGKAPAGALELLSAVSPITWTDQLGVGTLRLGAMFQLVAQISIFLAASVVVVLLRRRASDVARYCAMTSLVLVTTLLASIASGAVALSIPGQLDLTEEREFTQHPGTRAIVDGTPPGTIIELYWSASQVEIPTAIRTHARRTRALMEIIANQSEGRIEIRVVDPEPDTDEELDAVRKGVQRVPLSSGGYFYFGAVFQLGDRRISIPYFDIRRDRFLEYDIAVALSSLARVRPARIGILSPLLPTPTAYHEREGLSFVSELRRSYDIAFIPYFSESLPEDLDAVIVLQPSVLKREMLYSLDQFVLNGGGLIVTIDPFVRFDSGSNQLKFEPSKEIDDISDLLAAYGARYTGGQVVGDFQLASPAVDRNQVELSYPFWLKVNSDQLSHEQVVTTSLNEVFFVEAGAFDITEPTLVTPLVETTAQAGVLDRDEFRRQEPRTLASNLRVDNTPRVIAVYVHGILNSAYSSPPDFARTGTHLARSRVPSRIFAVADTDWLFDPFSVQKLDVGGQVMVRPLNDNVALLLNMVEFLSGSRELISIRTRGQLQRPFRRVEALFKDAQQAYRAKEQEIARRIEDLEHRLSAPLAAPLPGETPPAPAIASDLHEAQLALLSARKDLRDIRRRIREGVERLGRYVTVANILAGPLLVILFAALVHTYRRRRMRRWAPLGP